MYSQKYFFLWLSKVFRAVGRSDNLRGQVSSTYILKILGCPAPLASVLKHRGGESWSPTDPLRRLLHNYSCIHGAHLQCKSCNPCIPIFAEPYIYWEVCSTNFLSERSRNKVLMSIGLFSTYLQWLICVISHFPKNNTDCTISAMILSTDYWHTKAKSLIFAGPNSNPNPKQILIWDVDIKANRFL